VTRRLQAMKRPATISVGIRKVVMSVLSPDAPKVVLGQSPLRNATVAIRCS